MTQPASDRCNHMTAEYPFCMAAPKMCIAQHPEADALSASNPLALLIGMVLGQQVAA